MKKIMLVAALMLGASAAFAGDSEPLKAITKAKTYEECEQLIKTNLNSLASNAEKAKAYNTLTKLALQKFDKENAIQAQNMQAELMKQKTQPYDTLGFYEAAYRATLAGVECMKFDAMPDAKGKVKPKFTDELSKTVGAARMQLVTAGNAYAQKADEAGVLKYWGTFLDTDDNAAFASFKEQEKPFIGQVAYYSAQFANQAKQYDKADKYCDIAMTDPEMHDQAQTFKYTMAQRNLKTHADSLAYVGKMKDLYAKEPNNAMAFATLCTMYSGLNMSAELDALLDDKIAKDPNNFTAWAMKGQTLMNRNSTGDNPDWGPCVDAFKKAVAIDATNPAVLTYLGFSMNAQASQVNGNPAQQKAIYQESMGFIEKARDLDPNREKANWAYPLYQCYYILYGATDSRTAELEKMLK